MLQKLLKQKYNKCLSIYGSALKMTRERQKETVDKKNEKTEKT